MFEQTVVRRIHLQCCFDSSCRAKATEWNWCRLFDKNPAQNNPYLMQSSVVPWCAKYSMDWFEEAAECHSRCYSFWLWSWWAPANLSQSSPVFINSWIRFCWQPFDFTVMLSHVSEHLTQLETRWRSWSTWLSASFNKQLTWSHVNSSDLHHHMCWFDEMTSALSYSHILLVSIPIP